MNRPFTLFVLTALGLTLGLGIAACTITIDVSKPPVYAISADSLQTQLRHLVNCERFNLNGLEMTKNGKKLTELNIEIWNAAGELRLDDSTRILAKTVASTIKRALLDTAEYQFYWVGFQTKSGLSNWSTSFNFLSKDL